MELIRVRNQIEQKFFDLCSKVVNENDLKIYDLDYQPNQFALRVFIMNPETNTAVLDDCIKIDRALTPYIDEEDWMPAELTLEVSSPGLFRHLKEKWHFEMSIGEQIQLNLKDFLGEGFSDRLSKKNWKSKKVVGVLKGINDETLEIEIEEQLIPISLEQIKKANLEPNI